MSAESAIEDVLLAAPRVVMGEEDPKNKPKQCHHSQYLSKDHVDRIELANIRLRVA